MTGTDSKFIRQFDRLGWLGLFAGIAVLTLFVVLSVHAVQRPLWLDELMALVNYPLESWVEVFQPLPLYSQTAPPLFNGVSSLLSHLDPIAGRTVLYGTVSVGLTAAALAVFPRVWAMVVVLFVAIATIQFIPLASGFKYYGFEMMGAALILAWLLRKPLNDRLGPGDIAMLAFATCLGISGMVISVVAIASFVGLRWLGGARIGATEFICAAVLCIFLGGYYVLIKHGASINFQTFNRIYDVEGLRALSQFLGALIRFGGYTLLPVVILSVSLAFIDWRHPVSRKLLLVSLLTVAAFGLLAFVGKYPVSASRHVAWSMGFYVFLVVNACAILGRLTTRVSALSRWGLVGAAGLSAVAAMSPVHGVLLHREPYLHTDNRRIVEWLEAGEPRKIGVWFGAQPLIDYYRVRNSGVARHEYFGLVNAGSAPESPVAPETYTAEIGAGIEARRKLPGTIARQEVYRLVRNYTAPARSLIEEAPRGQTFYILASHSDLDGQDAFNLAVRGGLIDTLLAEGCSWDVELKVRKAHVLRALCPAT